MCVCFFSKRWRAGMGLVSSSFLNGSNRKRLLYEFLALVPQVCISCFQSWFFGGKRGNKQINEFQYERQIEHKHNPTIEYCTFFLNHHLCLMTVFLRSSKPLNLCYGKGYNMCSSFISEVNIFRCLNPQNGYCNSTVIYTKHLYPWVGDNSHKFREVDRFWNIIILCVHGYYIYISLYIFEYFQSTKNNTTWKGTVKTSEKKTTTLPKNKNNWLPNQRSLSILPVVVDSPCREWNKNCRREKLGSKTHGISSSWWHWRSFPMSALQCQTPEKVRRSSNP